MYGESKLYLHVNKKSKCTGRVSLGPHCAYFRMRTLKPQVAKVSTVASVMRDNWNVALK